MDSSKQLIDNIKSGEAGREKAMEMMYLDGRFLKSAKYWHDKFPALSTLTTPEDIHVEAIVRFVEAVLSKPDRHVTNCHSFFHRVCRNVVMEMSRKSKEAPADLVPSEEDNDPRIDQRFAALAPYVERMPNQCRLLLLLVFFHHPPQDPKNRQAIADELAKHGYQVALESISGLISRCKAKLRAAVQDDLDNFDDE